MGLAAFDPPGSACGASGRPPPSESHSPRRLCPWLVDRLPWAFDGSVGWVTPGGHEWLIRQGDLEGSPEGCGAPGGLFLSDAEQVCWLEQLCRAVRSRLLLCRGTAGLGRVVAAPLERWGPRAASQRPFC